MRTSEAVSNLVSIRELGDPLGDPLVVVNDGNNPRVQTFPDRFVFVCEGNVPLTYPSQLKQSNGNTLYMALYIRQTLF